jgi:hypothetical protein
MTMLEVVGFVASRLVLVHIVPSGKVRALAARVI